MTGHFHPLADPWAGADARRECRADLDKALEAPPQSEAASAFLKRWGEGLREALTEFDTFATEDDG